jgi:L-threonine kinase
MIAASCPLTCGELVQGWFCEEQALVSCPIDLLATATVEPLPTLEVKPSCFWKVRRALEVLVAAGYCAPCRAEVSLPVPVGKGFGTSTAHIVASAAAAGTLGGVELTPQLLARLAVSIEPSDSTMFDGLCLFAHRNGAFAVSLPQPPPIQVMVFDCGGEVDTLAYNRLDRTPALRSMASQYQDVQELLWEGLQSGDGQAVGLAATLSASFNQRFNPKPCLDLAIRVARDAGGLGVCVAHSGTLVGLLFPVDTDPSALGWAREKIPLMWRGIYRMRGGGVRDCMGPGAAAPSGSTSERLEGPELS